MIGSEIASAASVWLGARMNEINPKDGLLAAGFELSEARRTATW
jgi:hypothetical protein